MAKMTKVEQTLPTIKEKSRRLCPRFDGIRAHEPFPLLTDQLLQFPDTEKS